jgi:hypothetical protein
MIKLIAVAMLISTSAFANDFLQGGDQWLGGNQGSQQQPQHQQFNNGFQQPRSGGIGQQCAQTQCVTNGGFQNCFCTMWR